MSATLIASNVLLDLMMEDENWLQRSSAALAEAAESGRLVINPIICAEVSVHFSRVTELDEALPTELIEREDVSFQAAFLAGKAFLSYRRRGGTKGSPLPDFFIGAHAALAGYRLLTRDERRYRTYFPNLVLIVP